jgi:hypothetical protein
MKVSVWRQVICSTRHRDIERSSIELIFPIESNQIKLNRIEWFGRLFIGAFVIYIYIYIYIYIPPPPPPPRKTIYIYIYI